MQAKMGTFVPKTGTIVPQKANVPDYRAAIAAALREELGQTHRAIKTAMRWTGASERTVKYWIAGDARAKRRTPDRVGQTLGNRVPRRPDSCRSARRRGGQIGPPPPGLMCSVFWLY